MDSGMLVKWLKGEGEDVKVGDLLAEVETDKAVMELESYERGTLLYRAVKEGTRVPVDGVLAVVGKKGEDYAPLLRESESSNALPSESPKEAPVDSSKDSASVVEVAASQSNAVEKKSTKQPQAAQTVSLAEPPLRASPLARRLAKEKGYDIAHITGTGEKGRIIKRDIDHYTPVGAAVQTEHYRDVALSQMRHTIAQRLSQSKYTAPHYYLRMEAEVSHLVDARKRLNQNQTPETRISFNDLIVKATAMALRHHPALNVSLQGEDSLRYHSHIHIGVAVAVPDGLLVPVVRFADTKGLLTLSKEIKDLVARAQDKTLTPADWEGSTFSISNLGMSGIESFTAIINPPNACILAVGTILDQAVVQAGQVVAGKVLHATLSCDHRIVDGMTGAQFLRTLKGFLENPVEMLL